MRHKRFVTCIWGILLSVVALSGYARPCWGEPCLVLDGKPCADIVTAENPPRMVKLAAEELRAYLEKISGARLEIVTAPGTNMPAHVYLGRSRYNVNTGQKCLSW